MQDKELRGIVLEALYNQRRSDLVGFDEELGNLPVPDGALEGILRQLEKKDLIERPFTPLSGLGNGRITAHGIDVVEGTASPPFSILFHQHITTVQRSSDVQIGSGGIQNISDVENIPIDHSQAGQDAPKSVFEWISKLLVGTLKKFGLKSEGSDGQR